MDSWGTTSFNPRVREGRDDEIDGLSSSASDTFQSTRPRGTRPGGVRSMTAQMPFQSTRPRGTRLGFKLKYADQFVFQSTRPRGTRRSMTSMSSIYLGFQSTRPRGTRLRHQGGDGACRGVSIHASARDATQETFGEAAAGAFQSTRPRGTRPLHVYKAGVELTGFNPRVREGRDSSETGATSSRDAFQSTRPRGTRRFTLHAGVTLSVFQSTRPRGTRPKVASASYLG